MSVPPRAPTPGEVRAVAERVLAMLRRAERLDRLRTGTPLRMGALGRAPLSQRPIGESRGEGRP